MATLLTSVSHSFGSQITAAGTGVTLNNGMGNFDPSPAGPIPSRRARCRSSPCPS